MIGDFPEGQPCAESAPSQTPRQITTNRQEIAMKILVTSSRNPFALDIVRKLAEQGHIVDACDTFTTAAGNHSRYVARHHVVASPRHQTAQFIADIEAIVAERGIEMVLPCFEEAFYLATRHAELSAMTTLYTGQFAQLARLHDKVSFQHMAEDMGVRIPRTLVAHDDESLREAIGEFPSFFARAAFSRGGVALLTNSGPLAGMVATDDCHPNTEQPWLVQEFVSGPMVCSYSTVHHGNVTAHCTYRAPKQWEHSTGISFLGIDGAPTLDVVRTFAESMDYTGQLSFDFVESDGQLFLIECNPRSTDGVLLMTAEHLAAGITDPAAALTMVEPGTEIQLDFAVVAELFKEPLRQAPATIHDILHIHDSSRGWHDHMPMLWSFATMAKGERMSHRQRVAILEAMADDVVWNGEPIAGMNADDANTLADVHADRAR
jgi:predicted ATP-grasp superfamily ATP-dependent carboligase